MYILFFVILNVIQSEAKDLVDIHVFIHFVFSRSFVALLLWMTTGKSKTL